MKNKFFNKFRKSLKEVDDAELGRELKRMMTNVRDPGGNISAHICLASKMLVFCTHQTGSFRFEQVVENLTVEGKNVGNFKVTVERVKK